VSAAEQVHVGIDVSKPTLDVAMEPQHERCQVANDERGIQQLVERLRQLQPERIVLEATGGAGAEFARLFGGDSADQRVLGPEMTKESDLVDPCLAGFTPRGRAV